MAVKKSESTGSSGRKGPFRFLADCGLFLLLVIAMALAGEAAIRLWTKSSHKMKAEWMDAHAPEVETLILGDSRSYYGIRPDLIPGRAYNLANIAQNFIYDRMLLEKYGDRMPRLHTLICDVGYGILFDPDIDGPQGAGLAGDYIIFMDIGKRPETLTDWNIFHPAKYARRIRDMISGNLECDSLGFCVEYTLASRNIYWQKDDEVTWRLASWERETSMTAKNVRDLEWIAQWCQSRGVRLVLFSAPLWHKFREKADPYITNFTDSVADAVAARYGGVRLDYTADPRFVADDFLDIDHVASDTGAEKLTRIIVADLQYHGEPKR